MKNNIKYLLLLILFFPINVLAIGGITVSSSTIQLQEGRTESFNIKAKNVIGDLKIITENDDIVGIDKNTWSTGMVDDNQEVTGTITITGKNIGSTTITLILDDMVTFDEEDLSGQEIKINIEVIKKTSDEQQNIPKNNTKNIELILRDAKGNILPNTIVGIYDEKDNLLFSDITNENGVLIINDVNYGNYYFVLKESPNNYVINEEKYLFQVTDNTNDKIEVKVNIGEDNIAVASTGINKSFINFFIIGISCIVIGLFILLKIKMKYQKKQKKTN